MARGPRSRWCRLIGQQSSRGGTLGSGTPSVSIATGHRNSEGERRLWSEFLKDFRLPNIALVPVAVTLSVGNGGTSVFRSVCPVETKACPGLSLAVFRDCAWGGPSATRVRGRVSPGLRATRTCQREAAKGSRKGKGVCTGKPRPGLGPVCSFRHPGGLGTCPPRTQPLLERVFLTKATGGRRWKLPVKNGQGLGCGTQRHANCAFGSR